LEALVRHVEQPGMGGRSPCDLRLLRLSQDEIERIESKYPQLSRGFALSPLQEGLLFHSLYECAHADIYTVQLVLALAGPLDSAALRQAASALIERHASLRAGFAQTQLARPVQVIVAGLKPAGAASISHGSMKRRREARLTELLAQDRTLRFDVSSPPLQRLILIRLGPDKHRLVLTLHHLLLDGWSAAILVQETARSLCERRQCRGAAEWAPLSRLPSSGSRRRNARPLSRLAGGLGRPGTATRLSRYGGTAATCACLSK
jgi:hypothetical protein